MRRFTFETPEGNMAALEFGNPAGRLAALWLHATGFNAMTYQSLLAPLGLRTKVQALDLRGHGRTTLTAKPSELHSWRRYRDDVIAFMDRQSPARPIVLAGHSMGATVALLVAGRRPEKVAGLVLVDPVILDPRLYMYAHLMPFIVPLISQGFRLARQARGRRSEFGSITQIRESYARKPSFSSWREPFLDDYILDGFERVQDDASNVGKKGQETWKLLCDPKWEAATFASQRNQPWSALHKVRKHNIPITILRPEKGSVLSEKILLRLTRKCPHLVIKDRPNTSHFLPMETPYDVRECLSEYIARLIEGFGEDEDGRVKRSLRPIG